ncbi:MAG: glycoside hydrolase family 43 protein [Clostridia bacterium]|nr:glycoside hydrolase family 43 protein [Clostridia bacterium]
MKKLLILALSLMLCTILMVAASAAEFVNPVAPGADPFVLKDGDTYYLYATCGDAYGYRVFTSKNLVEWEGAGYCLLGEDVYQTPASDTYYGFWAPEIIKYEDTYYMIYTANHRMGIASSDSPFGPFTNDTENTGFLVDMQTLDGNFFIDNNGKVYLYFVTNIAKEDPSVRLNGTIVPSGSNIWGCELDMETLTIKENTLKLLLKHQKGDENCVEGPFMIKNGNTYYLTFSSGGYTNVDYAVCCATSSSPLGTFTRYASPVLECDDLTKTDVYGKHLYGTAHHCFTTAPSGELYIVYHAHRNSWTFGTEVDKEGNPTNTPLDTVGPRVTCIDKAGFDKDGKLWAGTREKGVPTATEQTVPTGAVLERETHYDGVFANVENKTIYVAYYDGIDTNDGATYETPVKTIERAAEILKTTGGTIALIQDYKVVHGSEDEEQYLDIPACDKPIVIKAASEKNKDLMLTYKFISVNSDVYFDNIIFVPETRDGMSVIECNFNNVTFGDGVSTLFSPKRREFPFIIGGRWQYTGANPAEVYNNFRYEESELSTDKEYSLKVYSGTWEGVAAGTMKGRVAVADSAPNAIFAMPGDAIIRPAVVKNVETKTSSAGTIVTFDEVEYAEKYQVLRNGDVVGYTDTTRFVDTTRVLGNDAEYEVRAYANGCCIGAPSKVDTIRTYGDMNGNGKLDFADALLLLEAIADGTVYATILDVLVLMRNV